MAESSDDRASDPLGASLRELPAHDKKIVGSLITTMIRHSEKVRDREWMSEQFVAAVALASDLEESSDPSGGVDDVQAYAKANIDRLMQLSFGLFARVAAEMAERNGFSYDDAVGCAMDQLG